MKTICLAGFSSLLGNRAYHARQLRRSSQNLVRLFLLITLIWILAGSQRLIAQRNADEARSLVGSFASTVYNLAWPTAHYEGATMGIPQRIGRGYDVPIVLYGRSGISDGPLWLEIVFELRDGELYNVRLGRDNAILMRPFETLQIVGTLGLAIAQEVMDDSDRDRIVGTWRGVNGTFTYMADGRVLCAWDSGSRETVAWSIDDGTLTWQWASGSIHRYSIARIGQNDQELRSLRDGRVWTLQRIGY